MEMNKFEVLALNNVTAKSIQDSLSSRGLIWQDVLHVTATNSLASAFRDSGTLAHPIGLLFDMFVGPTKGNKSRLDLDSFPDSTMFYESKETKTNYMVAMTAWTQRLSYKRLHQSSAWSQALRDYVSQLELDTDLKHLLRKNSAELLKSFIKLSNDGIYPSDFSSESSASRASKLEEAAVQLWTQLENEFPEFASGRESLWMDLKEYKSGKTALAKEVSNRLKGAFNKAFGNNSAQITIVHHGFYFYTPLQWAFFKLIQETPGFNQLFILHDDGKNPALRIWREFFSERLSMPNYSSEIDAVEPKTKRAKFFLELISGESRNTHVENLNLSIEEYQNTSEFARELRQYKANIGDSEPQIYAPAVKDVKRFVDRVLNPTSQNPTNLVELPAGIFLQSIHDCIKVATDGSYSLIPTTQDVRRILGSGFLRFSLEGDNNEANLVLRSLRYFEDCRSIGDWKTRAEKLARLIIDEVHNLDPKGNSRQTKFEKVKAGSQNPLRLLPWLDFGDTDAIVIKSVIHKIMTLLERVYSTERITLGKHADSISEAIKEWMAHASAEEQSRISKALDVLRFADDGEVDAIGLVDVVSRILSGVEDENESQSSEIGDFDPASLMRMGDLDRLGYSQTQVDTQICNLAEGSFPNQQKPVPWPFSLESFSGSVAEKFRKISVEIYRLRSITSTLEDLYLFWLALEGVSDQASLKLSWIARIGSEDKLPSNFIRICSKISKVDTVTSEYLGGLTIRNSRTDAANFTNFRNRVPLVDRHDESAFVAGASKFGFVAASSLLTCSRRFALQWVLSDSASFEPEHTQEILWGNLRYPIYREFTDSRDPEAWNNSGRLQRDLGISLSEAVKSSSQNKRVVKRNGAKPVWIYSLGGRNNPSANDPQDIAYKANLRAVLDYVEPQLHGSNLALPRVEPTKAQQSVCNVCPVSKTCTAAVTQLTVAFNS